MKAIDKFRRLQKAPYSGFDVLKNHIFNTYPIEYVDNTDDLSVLEKHNSDFVWLVNKNIKTLDTFPWWLKPKEKDVIHVFPYVNKSKWYVRSWNMVKLVPTNIKTEKIIKHDYICGIHDTYYGKDLYDIFYVGDVETDQYKKLLLKFSNTKVVKDFNEAKENAETDFFWIVPDDVIITDRFKFDYEPDDWSHDYIHVFKNGVDGNFDGVALFPKTLAPSKKELNHRFYIKKKEINVVASVPVDYEMFFLESYRDYLNALKNSKTELFWYIPKDVDLKENFQFTRVYDRSVNHVFLNGTHKDGIVLFSKNSPVTEKEFLTRNYKEKKEWPIVASFPKNYDQFTINTYDDYLKAKKNSTTDMFYGIPSDVIVEDSFKFDLYFNHANQYDRNITHVFLNGKVYNGISLFSKNNTLTKKEIEYRFYIEKKEWNILASKPKNINKNITDAFSAWSLGFVETVNLALGLYTDGKINQLIKEEMYKNCNELKDISYADYYIRGANAGKDYGLKNLGEADKLAKIQKEDWLKKKFNQLCQLV